MNRANRCVVVLAAASIFVLVAGCGPKSGYVYKPNPPMAGERKLPVKVAVLPFEDGTENFTRRGSITNLPMYYNLAKAGMSGGMPAMPPPFWGKSFAEELAASGSFQSARFVYSPSEIQDETFIIDGTLKKVTYVGVVKYENEILVVFRATRISDRKPVWEKEVARVWKIPESFSAECGLGMQCFFDKMYGDWNKWMSGVLAEARTDLVGTIDRIYQGK